MKLFHIKFQNQIKKSFKHRQIENQTTQENFAGDDDESLTSF